MASTIKYYNLYHDAAAAVVNATHYVASESVIEVYARPDDTAESKLGCLKPGTAVRVTKEYIGGILNASQNLSGTDTFLGFHEIVLLSPNTEGISLPDIFDTETPDAKFYVKNTSLLPLDSTPVHPMNWFGIQREDMSSVGRASIPDWWTMATPYYHTSDLEYWVTVTLPSECIFDQQDLDLKKSDARFRAIKHLFKYYALKEEPTSWPQINLYNGFLTSYVADVYMNDRPGSKIKMLVKIPAQYFNWYLRKNPPKCITAVDVVLGAADKLLAVPIDVLEDISHATRTNLLKYDKQMKASGIRIPGLNLKKEAHRIDGQVSKIKELLVANKHNLPGTAEKIVLGTGPSGKLLWAMANYGDNGTHDLVAGFDELFKNGGPIITNILMMESLNMKQDAPIDFSGWIETTDVPKYLAKPLQGADLMEALAEPSPDQLSYSFKFSDITDMVDVKAGPTPENLDWPGSPNPGERPDGCSGTTFVGSPPHKNISVVREEKKVKNNPVMKKELAKLRDSLPTKQVDSLLKEDIQDSIAKLKGVLAEETAVIRKINDLLLNRITLEQLMEYFKEGYLKKTDVKGLLIDTLKESTGVCLDDRSDEKVDCDILTQNDVLEMLPQPLYPPCEIPWPSFDIKLKTYDILEEMIKIIKFLLEKALAAALINLITSFLNKLVDKGEDSTPALNDYGATDLGSLFSDFGSEEDIKKAFVECGVPDYISADICVSFLTAISGKMTSRETLNFLAGTPSSLTMDIIRETIEFDFSDFEEFLMEDTEIEDFGECIGKHLGPSVTGGLENNLIRPEIIDICDEEAIYDKCGDPDFAKEMVELAKTRDIIKFQQIQAALRDPQCMESLLPGVFTIPPRIETKRIKGQNGQLSPEFSCLIPGKKGIMAGLEVSGISDIFDEVSTTIFGSVLNSFISDAQSATDKLVIQNQVIIPDNPDDIEYPASVGGKKPNPTVGKSLQNALAIFDEVSYDIVNNSYSVGDNLSFFFPPADSLTTDSFQIAIPGYGQVPNEEDFIDTDYPSAAGVTFNPKTCPDDDTPSPEEEAIPPLLAQATTLGFDEPDETSDIAEQTINISKDLEPSLKAAFEVVFENGAGLNKGGSQAAIGKAGFCATEYPNYNYSTMPGGSSTAAPFALQDAYKSPQLNILESFMKNSLGTYVDLSMLYPAIIQSSLRHIASDAAQSQLFLAWIFKDGQGIPVTDKQLPPWRYIKDASGKNLKSIWPGKPPNYDIPSDIEGNPINLIKPPLNLNLVDVGGTKPVPKIGIDFSPYGLGEPPTKRRTGIVDIQAAKDIARQNWDWSEAYNPSGQSSFQKATLQGIIDIMIQTYSIELLLRSIFVDSKFDNSKNVDQLMVDLIYNQMNKGMLESDVQGAKFYREFRKQVVEMAKDRYAKGNLKDDGRHISVASAMFADAKAKLAAGPPKAPTTKVEDLVTAPLLADNTILPGFEYYDVDTDGFITVEDAEVCNLTGEFQLKSEIIALIEEIKGKTKKSITKCPDLTQNEIDFITSTWAQNTLTSGEGSYVSVEESLEAFAKSKCYKKVVNVKVTKEDYEEYIKPLQNVNEALKIKQQADYEKELEAAKKKIAQEQADYEAALATYKDAEQKLKDAIAAANATADWPDFNYNLALKLFIKESLKGNSETGRKGIKERIKQKLIDAQVQQKETENKPTLWEGKDLFDAAIWKFGNEAVDVNTIDNMDNPLAPGASKKTFYYDFADEGYSGKEHFFKKGGFVVEKYWRIEDSGLNNLIARNTKWKGVVSENDFLQFLTFLGWPDDDNLSSYEAALDFYGISPDMKISELFASIKVGKRLSYVFLEPTDEQPELQQFVDSNPEFFFSGEAISSIDASLEKTGLFIETPEVDGEIKPSNLYVLPITSLGEVDITERIHNEVWKLEDFQMISEGAAATGRFSMWWSNPEEYLANGGFLIDNDPKNEITTIDQFNGQTAPKSVDGLNPEEFKSYADYKLITQHCLPMQRLIDIVSIYCMIKLSTLPNIKEMFKKTKKEAKKIFLLTLGTHFKGKNKIFGFTTTDEMFEANLCQPCEDDEEQ